MDSLEKILGEYMELVTDIHFDKTTYKVAVKFGTQIIPIKDSTNKVKISQTTKGAYVYEIDKSNGLDQLALFIKKTIEQNLEAKMKSKLFTQITQNLQQVFNEHSIEELQTLRFVFGTDAENLAPTDTVDFSKKLETTSIASDNLTGKQENSVAPVVEPNVTESPIMDEVEYTPFDDSNENEKPTTHTISSSGLVTGKVNVIM